MLDDGVKVRQVNSTVSLVCEIIVLIHFITTSHPRPVGHLKNSQDQIYN